MEGLHAFCQQVVGKLMVKVMLKATIKIGIVKKQKYLILWYKFTTISFIIAGGPLCGSHAFLAFMNGPMHFIFYRGTIAEERDIIHVKLLLINYSQV